VLLSFAAGNYSKWCIYMRASLGRSGYLGHVDGTVAAAPTDVEWATADYTGDVFILDKQHYDTPRTTSVQWTMQATSRASWGRMRSKTSCVAKAQPALGWGASQNQGPIFPPSWCHSRICLSRCHAPLGMSTYHVGVRRVRSMDISVFPDSLALSMPLPIIGS
jgi:hypothetical protein